MLAIYTCSNCDICCLLTIIDECEVWDEREFVQQLVGYSIPLGNTSSLLILNASIDSDCLVAICRICACRECLSSQFHLSSLNSSQISRDQRHDISFRADILEIHDRSSCSRDYSSRDVEVLRMWQESKQIVVDHLVNCLSGRHWAYIWNSILGCARRQNLTHHYHQIARLVGKGQLEVLTILLNGSQIYFVPLCFKTRLLNGSIPIQELALLASSNLHWLGIHHLFVYYHVVELNGQLLCSVEADICCLAIDHTCHVIHHLFGHSSISSHCQLLVDGSLHRVSKRDLLGQNCIYASIVGDYKLSLHTAWCAECSHWYLKDMLTRDGICLSLFQHIIYHPCLNYWSWSRHFFYAESECLIGSELEVYIILLEFINKHATELLCHVSTCSDDPVVTKHHTGRTVKTEVKLYSSILTSLVCHHEVELLVLRLHLGQVQSIPFLTSLYIYATPLEVICLLTSQVHDVTCLILLSRKHDVL